MSKRKRSAPGEDLPPGKKTAIKAEEEEEVDEEEDEADEAMVDLSQNPDFCDRTNLKTEAEVGIIEQVSLKNFMCHARLDFSFGPQVNFLIGRNGSGKSAVLTAIMVALGGKANVTNRGSSLKSFIKQDKQFGVVSVKLRNRGSDAYKPQLYGDAIRVERRITAEGSSSYKLRSSQGKVVSSKREELGHILDQFNIQVDNPVAILTQETSRNFLHSKSAQDRYKFFLKATQLESMKNDYVVANESKRDAQRILEQKKKTLPDLEKEVFGWEQKYKALSSLGSLRDKVTKLENEIAWATIIEKERALEPFTKQLEQEEARTPKFLQKIQESQEKVTAATQKQKDISKDLVDLGARVKALEPKKDDAKTILNERKKNLRTAQGELRKVQKELDSLNKDRKQLMRRIEEIRSSAQQDYESERRERQQTIENLQQQVQALDATRKTTQHSVEQFHSFVQQRKQELSNLRTEEIAIKNEIQNTNRRLQNLRGARSNTLKRYGNWMPELMQKIETAHRAGRFHKKPRGPIGASLQLRDQRWALAVECCIKGLLTSFCVNDHHDEKELEKLMAGTCPDRKPVIITSRFLNDRYNVGAHRPQCRYPTVLDELIIEDVVIANCVIDQRSVESVILIENGEEARQVMSSNRPPQKVKEAFTGTGDQLYSQPMFRYYSSNTEHARYLTASVEDDIRTCGEELAQQNQRLAQVRAQINAKDADIRSNTTEERRALTQLHKLQDDISKLTLEIDELKNIEDPAPVDIATLEEDVRSYDENITDVEGQLQKVQESYEKCNQEKDDAEAVFREVDRQIREVLETGDPAKDRLAESEMELQQAKDHKKHYDGKLKEHEAAKNDLRKRIAAMQKDIDENTAKAQELCERIRTRRTVQNLQSEILQIQKRINNEEKNRGNPEEITRRYSETKNKFKKIKIEVNQLNNFLKELEKVMRHRQQQYFEFRRMIALRAKYFFIVMLSNRQYTGKMVFDHRQEVLSLSVAPDSASQPEMARDMRALSGGERSFSTVCFILALWDAMESPFRCLDEFDVFMDMVNRRMSMDMMMGVAKAQGMRQFIFLTPQDMSQLKHSSNVRVFEMRPPERDQGTLPYRPEGQEDEEDEAEENTQA